MISCHMVNETGPQEQSANQNQQPAAHILHQQASMYAHVSPVFGAPYVNDSNDNLLNNSNQLMRSKSLNDISNDSQILAFANGRSTHLHINSNVGGDATNIDCQNIVVQSNLNSHNNNTTVTTQCMPIVDNNNQQLYSIYNQQQCTSNNGTTFNNDPFNNPHLTWNSNNSYGNQCSNNINRTPTHSMSGTVVAPSVATPTTPANIFTLCNPLGNPLAMNLNSVTEQIGNLQL